MESMYEESTIRVCIGTGIQGPIFADLRIPTPVANLLSVLKQVMNEKVKS